MFTMERWLPIQTERLRLREMRLADLADVHEYAADPLVSRFESWGPNTPEITEKVMQDWLTQQQNWPREEVNAAVELTSERRLIGVVSLRMKNDADRTANLGYAFNRQYWNQGHATEATRALLDVAFRLLNAHRVWASCDTRNIGSYRVMEKLGMRREAHLRKDVWQKGEWRDSYRYAVLEEEWFAR